VASFAINIERYNLPQDYYNTYVMKVENVSAMDIQEMALKYIKPDNLYIIAVGKGSEIEDQLDKFGPVTYYDPYGNIVDPAKAKLPPGLNADQVIENYIAAIGGKEKLLNVNDIKYNMKADVMGNSLDMEIFKKEPNKLKVEVSMGPNLMSQQVFDGDKARLVQMGNEIKADEKILEKLKIEGYVFPELKYEMLDIETELTGIENIDGKDAYSVEVTYPSGEKVTNYYDVTTGYKIRETETVDSPEGKITASTEFSDFREQDGIVFPFLFKIPMGQGMKMNAEIESIEINAGLEDELFSVE
jgi:hypothetical protein